MPNHVINEVIFRKLDSEHTIHLKSAVLNREGEIDFSILLPTPLNSWRGGVGTVHKVFPSNNLDWCATNWGTKWNAYGQGKASQEFTPDSLTFRFKTAWAPPYGWLCALLNVIQRPFEHNWLDEGAAKGHSASYGYRNGGDMFTGGYQFDQRECDEAMQRHLHLLLWGVEEFTEG